MRWLPVLLLVLVAMLVRPSPAASATGLRLMTYNVNYGNLDHEATLDAVAAEDPDVVLLQEITVEWRRALEARFARQYPYRSYQIHAAVSPCCPSTRSPRRSCGRRRDARVLDAGASDHRPVVVTVEPR